MSQAAAPVGWPKDLPPPVIAEFRAKVTGWLLDRGPSSLRASRVWREQPEALAMVVMFHTEHVVLSLRDAYSAVRRELSDTIDARGIDQVLGALEGAGAEANEMAREVSLVAEALAGKTWRERL